MAKNLARRRMGPTNSASRDALLDAAEHVLQNSGYGALTARCLAEEAGFNHQTVYYYFQSMDDLVTQAFHRRAKQTLKQMERCEASDRPVRCLFDLIADQGNNKLSLEYAAIATHIESLAHEINAFLDLSRSIEEKTIARALRKAPAELAGLMPGVAAMLAVGAAQLLAREAALGFDRGHAEMRGFLEWCIDLLEPCPLPPG